VVADERAGSDGNTCNEPVAEDASAHRSIAFKFAVQTVFDSKVSRAAVSSPPYFYRSQCSQTDNHDLRHSR